MQVRRVLTRGHTDCFTNIGTSALMKRIHRPIEHVLRFLGTNRAIRELIQDDYEP